MQVDKYSSYRSKRMGSTLAILLQRHPSRRTHLFAPIEAAFAGLV